MDEKQETASVVFKGNSTVMNFIKTYGLSIALLIGGLIIRNNDLEEIKAHNAQMEAMLFDCYEKRIDSKSTASFPILPKQSYHVDKLFTIMTKKENSYDYTFI